MAKRQKCDCPPGLPEWLLTYGDMMSLLLTFFILLLAFSSTDAKKAQEAFLSIQGALGVLPKELSVIQVSSTRMPARRAPRRIERLARELQSRLQVRGKDRDVKVEYDASGGLKISLPSQILFDSAQAELKPEAHAVLTDVAQLLTGVAGAAIEIRGFTDNRPLVSSALYKDNYDLSYARAKSVASYVNSAGAIPMEMLEIIAHGPAKPVATNDTEEGRQANRRVEIYVRDEGGDESLKQLNERVNALPPPGQSTPDGPMPPAPPALTSQE